MDKSLKIQTQIRHNAEEVSSYLSDLAKWENAAKIKDQTIQAKASKSKQTILQNEGRDLSSSASSTPQYLLTNPTMPSNPTILTPASIIGNNILSSTMDENSIHVPAPRRQISTKDPETAERERGNEEYQKGNFQEAVKCYTRCLGLKVANYVAFSNRAMALLKMKEYVRAETDCDCALKIEPNHVKSLVRRATARNALGKHRAALMDLIKAEELESSNKQIRVDMQKTRELLRSAVNRAPLVRILQTNDETTDIIAGPDMPISISNDTNHISEVITT